MEVVHRDTKSLRKMGLGVGGLFEVEEERRHRDLI